MIDVQTGERYSTIVEISVNGLTTACLGMNRLQSLADGDGLYKYVAELAIPGRAELTTKVELLGDFDAGLLNLVREALLQVIRSNPVLGTPYFKGTHNRETCARCGDTITSRYRHDFKTCRCGAISVDGGYDYTRRCYKGTENGEHGKHRDGRESADACGKTSKGKAGAKGSDCKKAAKAPGKKAELPARIRR